MLVQIGSLVKFTKNVKGTCGRLHTVILDLRLRTLFSKMSTSFRQFAKCIVFTKNNTCSGIYILSAVQSFFPNFWLQVELRRMIGNDHSEIKAQHAQIGTRTTEKMLVFVHESLKIISFLCFRLQIMLLTF